MRNVVATFNYTNRQRIERELITFSAGDDEGDGYLVLDRLSIEHLGLEPSAKLVLDCKSSATGTIRFELGTVASPSVGVRCPFPRDVLAAVTLSLKVVSQVGSRRGQILASCRGLRPNVGGRPQSLLPVVPADLGDAVWHLNFDAEHGPELQLNDRIENFFEVYRNPVFLALVMPEIVLRIAIWTHSKRDEPAESDLGKVVESWLDLLHQWGFDAEPDADDDEVSRQASSCSQAFATSHRYLANFLGLIRSES
jgi:hypothetical protein